MNATTITLSGPQRGALRRALVSNPGWKALREERGYDISTMSRQSIVAAANDLGIDVFAAIAGADQPSNPVAAAPLSIAPALANGAPVAEAAATAREAVIERGHRVAAEMVASGEMEAAPSDDGAQLAALIASIAGRTMRPDQISALVRREIAAALKDATPCVTIEVRREGDLIGKLEGHQHPRMVDLLRAASARMADGFSPSVWLAGPAGSGKTTAVKHVAKALQTAWHYNGALGMAHELTGFVDAGGTYHRTPFRDAYEHGGCYLFDEVDGSDNAALLALNAALANGCASFPDAQVERHADNRIFAAANTWGHGATAEYVGRAKIDGAFLDRFPVRIQWDYDAALEVAIAGNPDFARRVQGARERARAAGLKVQITPRASIAGSALIGAGFTSDEAAGLTYLANLSDDQRRMIEGR
jgi:hypothetical protein